MVTYVLLLALMALWKYLWMTGGSLSVARISMMMLQLQFVGK
jgi:predicted membrane metal-binding protein